MLPEDGCLRLIDQGAFVYTAVYTIKIPNTVEEIARCAMSCGAVFDTCPNLVTVIFMANSKCRKIGSVAFFV